METRPLFKVLLMTIFLSDSMNDYITRWEKSSTFALFLLPQKQMALSGFQSSAHEHHEQLAVNRIRVMWVQQHYLCICECVRSQKEAALTRPLSSLTHSPRPLTDHFDHAGGEVAHSVISCAVIVDAALPPPIWMLLQNLHRIIIIHHL